MITLLLVCIAVSFGALVGMMVGIGLVLRDVRDVAYRWRVAALAEPLYGDTLTACADELEHLRDAA
jgi:ABC-type methionine transport system permease subunit